MRAPRRAFTVTVMTTAYIFAISTLGLNLITGYTGQFNLAHAAFMALGAYTVGILTVDYNWPFWWAFLAACPVVMIIGIPLGWLSLRLKGHYFSIFTLCLGLIVFLVIEKWDGLTHGVVGIIGVPAPSVGDFEFTSSRSTYYLVFAFLCAATWFMLRLVNSLVGRSFIAIRNGDDLAQALGINLARTKLLAFLISILYAGLAGGLYAGFVRFLSPDLASEMHTFEMTMYMLVGGIGTVFGPLLGAIIVPWLTQFMQFLADYRFVVFGPLLILIVIFVPNGIVGGFMAWRARRAAGTSPGAAGVTVRNDSGAPNA
ncbi:MAG TPA: branched-chain amino acid ABC transporter permease [Rubrivivax sp.]|nr:branched-chain amino acid ABC transporter permease [Rubrivivax sp.]